MDGWTGKSKFADLIVFGSIDYKSHSKQKNNKENIATKYHWAILHQVLVV